MHTTDFSSRVAPYWAFIGKGTSAKGVGVTGRKVEKERYDLYLAYRKNTVTKFLAKIRKRNIVVVFIVFVRAVA